MAQENLTAYERMKLGLFLISQLGGKTLLGDGRYDEGAAAAFNQAAEIAQDVLTAVDELEETDKEVGEKRNWRKYRVRTCYTMHFCEICRNAISLGEIYFDGGYGRRAHVECVEKQEGAGA
jgi:hypothetical protein